MTKILSLVVLVIVASCTFKKSALKNQVSKGHEELYAEPSEPKTLASEDDVERIVIASTNDLQGQASPLTDSYNIKLGGFEVLAQYFKILRSTYDDLVLVDAGNFLPADTSLASKIHDFYETQNYDAVTLGLNDFNLRIPKSMSSSTELFQQFTKTSTPPLVLSNLFQLKTGRTVEWEGSKPYVIKEIRGVKVGIIGLVAHDIVNKTPVQNRTGLFIEEMVQSTLRHARLLRSLGVDLIVVTTHEGIDCGEELAEAAKLPLSKVNFEAKTPKVCDLNSEMGNFLTRLPPHLVDVVISGRVAQKTVNFVNDTLVLSGYHKGKSINYVEFFVDKKAHKVLKDRTIVHQPVLTCHEFFQETNDCYTEDPSVDHSKKVPAKFLGKDIVPDVETSEPIQTSLNTEQDQIVKSLKAHLAFKPDSARLTQLFTFDITGSELSQILEEEYNQGNLEHWFPNPFSLLNNQLKININGQQISHSESYKIVTDVESALASSFFKRKIKSDSVLSYPSLSWASADQANDEVQTLQAAALSP